MDKVTVVDSAGNTQVFSGVNGVTPSFSYNADWLLVYMQKDNDQVLVAAFWQPRSAVRSE